MIIKYSKFFKILYHMIFCIIHDSFESYKSEWMLIYDITGTFSDRPIF
jgi:hypothetical protein